MERDTLLEDIRQSTSPLLGPRPLAHSQELAKDLPVVRKHLGPRAWYQALEAQGPGGQAPGRPSE